MKNEERKQMENDLRQAMNFASQNIRYWERMYDDWRQALDKLIIDNPPKAGGKNGQVSKTLKKAKA